MISECSGPWIQRVLVQEQAAERRHLETNRPSEQKSSVVVEVPRLADFVAGVGSAGELGTRAAEMPSAEVLDTAQVAGIQSAEAVDNQ